MTDHPTPELLGEYLDGALSAADRERVEAHLVRCAPCTSDLARLRSIVAAAGALPSGIEPPPELWGEIRRTLEARKIAPLNVVHLGDVRRSAWTPGRVWAVAATVLLVITSMLTGWLLLAPTRPSSTVGMAPDTPVVAAPAAVARIDRDYATTLDQLTASLRERSATTPRKTIATVNHSLQIVDSAIAETRAALIQDPANRGIAELLSVNYQKKLDLLKRASELATEF